MQYIGTMTSGRIL